MTATAWPPLRCKCSRLIATGAAVARLDVKPPAAATGWRSAVATRARSSAPDSLMPQCTPLATKPSTAVVVTRTPRSSARGSGETRRGPRRNLRFRWGESWIDADRRESRRLLESQREIGALDRLSRRTLHEVVDGAQHDHPPGALVIAHAQVRAVRSPRRLGGRRPLVDDDEGRAAIAVGEGSQQTLGRDVPTG